MVLFDYLYYDMTRTAPRAISLENRKKKRSRMRDVRVKVIGPEKTRTAPIEMRTAPAKTMRNNFVAKKCFLENE